MKKSLIVSMMVMFGILILLGACGDSDKPKYTEGQELTLSGKIKIVDNDGTFYVLVTDQNEFFEIPTIKDEYKIEGTPIKAKVKIIKLITISRLGPLSEVIEYLE
jgi:major membrane immunogen (membrane-anchored lipoprotein)